MAIEDLIRAEESIAQLAKPPVSRLMFLLWRSREDLREAFDLGQASGQQGLVGWYRTTCIGPTAGPTALIVGGNAGFTPAGPGRNLDRLVANVVDRIGRLTRWLPEALRIRARQGARILSRVAARVAARAAARAAADCAPVRTPAAAAVRRSAAVQGINLVGHVHGEFGLGQHLRHTAAALEAAALPFGLVDFRIGVPGRQKAATRHRILPAGNPYRTNVFLMSPARVPDAFCHFGQDFFANRLNVLFAVWELANWPEPWRDLLELFDEIWVPTRFVEAALKPHVKCPVIRVPLCIELPPSAGRTRAFFGLTEGAFLFLTVVDTFSFLERKNPLATLHAFRQAFPDRSANVGLVVKAMNVGAGNAVWRRLLEECAGDARVVVLDRVIDFDAMADLYRCTDCYVSLHRSEGFGMCAAEAMCAGKPVVVTNYSGNVDFTLPDNACLVDYRLIPVGAGQYPFADGQVWAEPNLEHAASHMRRLYQDRAYAAATSAKAASWARRFLDPAAGAQGFAEAIGWPVER